MMNKPLHNKIALITGASRGLGLAAARRLAAEGAEVILHYGRSEQAALDLKAQLIDAGHKARVIQGSFESQAGLEDFLGRVNQSFQTVSSDGQFDVLINNAGIIRTKTIHDTRYTIHDTPEEGDAGSISKIVSERRECSKDRAEIRFSLAFHR